MSTGKPVPTNVQEWSEASQRSATYCAPDDEYDDIHYECYHCQRPAVFTAEQQRRAFEVRKVYIWQRRTLCEECFAVRVSLEREVKEFNRRWKVERRALSKEVQALRRWLVVLELLPSYGVRKNTAHIAMLKRLSSSVA